MRNFFNKFFEQPQGKQKTPGVSGLLERSDSIIQKYLNRIGSASSTDSYYVDNQVRDCLNEIAKSEGDQKSAPGYQYYSRWRSSAVNPDYKNLGEHLHKAFTSKYEQRQQEQKTIEKRETENKCEALQDKYKALIDRFFEIAYRKVTTVDQYGDENWKAYEKELTVVICKIAEAEGARESTIKDIKKGYFWSNRALEQLREKIDKAYKVYHAAKKSAGPQADDINSLAGVEFENYLMGVFKIAGYDVSGTPATGDQGADMILAKSGVKIAVQAKRFTSNVGNKAVQEVTSARQYYSCKEAWVVTNSKFTKAAMELAHKCNVRLIDGQELSELVNSLKAVDSGR